LQPIDENLLAHIGAQAFELLPEPRPTFPVRYAAAPQPQSFSTESSAVGALPSLVQRNR